MYDQRLFEDIRNNGGADSPRRLPRFFVVPTDAKADFPVGLDATVGGGEAEAGGAKRVGRREYYTAMVEAFAVGRVGGPAHGEMPLEKICIERAGCIIR